MDPALRSQLSDLRAAVVSVRGSIEALRAAAAAKYQSRFAADLAEMGGSDLPPRSHEAVLLLLDAIQINGGTIPDVVEPPFGKSPLPGHFLVKFGVEWRTLNEQLSEAERAETAGALSVRDALTRAVEELHGLYPVPSNKVFDLNDEVRATRVLAETNALAIARLEAAMRELGARKKLPNMRDFSVAECLSAGFSAAQMKAAGFDASTLKEGGFNADVLIAAGFDAAALKAAGFDAAALRVAGCHAVTLKAAGFDAPALKVGGFSGFQVKYAGFSEDELKAAGFHRGDY